VLKAATHTNHFQLNHASGSSKQGMHSRITT